MPEFIIHGERKQRCRSPTISAGKPRFDSTRSNGYVLLFFSISQRPEQIDQICLIFGEKYRRIIETIIERDCFVRRRRHWLSTWTVLWRQIEIKELSLSFADIFVLMSWKRKRSELHRNTNTKKNTNVEREKKGSIYFDSRGNEQQANIEKIMMIDSDDSVFLRHSSLQSFLSAENAKCVFQRSTGSNMVHTDE